MITKIKPRGPYDLFEDGKLCDCKDCVEYRKIHTKEEWEEEINNERK